jgi:hypothetical protein
MNAGQREPSLNASALCRNVLVKAGINYRTVYGRGAPHD